MLLIAVAARHGDELTADFLRLYGIPDWRAVPPARAASLCAAMIRQSESWTHRAIVPHWRWEDPAVAIAALQADYLALQVWMASKDGQRGRNRPKPIPRPTDHSVDGGQVAVDERALDRILTQPRGALTTT